MLSSSPPSLIFQMSLRMEVAKDDPVWAGLSSTQSRGMLKCADLHRRKVECLAHAYEVALKPAFLGASSRRQGSSSHRQPSLGPDVPRSVPPFLLPFLFLCLSWALLSSWCLHFPETLHCPTLCSAYVLPAPIPALTLIAVVFWATLLSQAQDLSSPLSCSLLQQALDCRASISYLTLVVCPTWLLGLSLNSQQCPSTAVP